VCFSSWCISEEKAQLKNADNLPYLFQRYLDGHCTPDELQSLFQYFDSSDELELRELIREELENTRADVADPKDRRLKLGQLFEGVSDRISHTTSRTIQLRPWLIAASIAATLFLVAGYFISNTNKPVKMETVFAPYGKRIEVRLPDSSKAWLNSGTTLMYPVAFNSNTRSVILKDGEAFFEVKHDAHKPFIVHTENANINVVGTSFEVSAYKNDPETKVTVETGKVGLLLPASDTPANFLLPGDRETINNVTHEIRLLKIDRSEVAAWRNNRMIFENLLIAEVIHSLERTYNVKIKIENTHLFNERVTMRLNRQPLDNVLTAMGFSHHFTFKKINEQLVIVK
jgi:transmembrane sensor